MKIVKRRRKRRFAQTGAIDSIPIKSRVAGTRVGPRSVGAGGLRTAIIAPILSSTLVVISAGDTVAKIPRVASTKVGTRGVRAGSR